MKEGLNVTNFTS